MLFVFKNSLQKFAYIKKFLYLCSRNGDNANPPVMEGTRGAISSAILAAAPVE